MDVLVPDKPVGPVGIPAGGVAKAATAENDKKIKKACSDFEAMLVHQLLKAMRQTVPKGGLLESSHAKDNYEMLLDQKIADEIVRKGQGLGLQTVLYKQITRQNRKPD